MDPSLLMWPLITSRLPLVSMLFHTWVASPLVPSCPMAIEVMGTRLPRNSTFW